MSDQNNKHILGSFGIALQSLRNNTLMMASLAERNITNSAKGLFERDSDSCNIAIADDEEIDLLEMQIDRDGVDILLRYQPFASDLRHVVASMKFSSNVERIADQAVGIARRAKKLNAKPILPEVPALEPIYQHTLAMYQDAVKAFSDSLPELARTLRPRDKELDRLNREFAEKCTIRMTQDGSLVDSYLNLIFVARFFERIGDNATNMAEDTVYALENRDIRHDPRYAAAP